MFPQLDATKLLSYGELDRVISSAFDKWYYDSNPALPGEEVAYCWLMAVYPEYAVACMGTGQYFQVNYTMNKDGVAFAPVTEWVRLEHSWKPVKSTVHAIETLSYQGGELKALGNGKIGGYLVRFGGKDLMDEWFTKNTYFGPSDGNNADCCFHHMIPIKEGLEYLAEHLFQPIKTTKDDIGIFAETVMNMADEYEAAIYGLVEKSKLGWSSGAPGHMVRRLKSGEITRWPIAEGSTTPQPAEPRNRAFPVKSLPLPIEVAEAFKSFRPKAPAADSPAELPEAELSAVTLDSLRTGGITITDSTVTIGSPMPAATLSIPPVITDIKDLGSPIKEETIMPENQTVPDPNAAHYAALEASNKKMSDAFEALLKRLENTPAGEGITHTNMGGTQDVNVKSFADFALAVARKDIARIEKVYASKAVAEDQGATGGYYVPTSYSAELVAAQTLISPVVAKVRQIPVNSPAGNWPVLALTTAPTAGSGNTALASGLISSNIAEGGTYTDRNVYFDEINWRVAKHGDIVNVSEEMMADAPQLDGLLRALMTSALAARKERNVLSGTGVGEPLGILNAPCLINVTKATASHFTFTDVGVMLSRFKMLSGDPSRLCWIAHPSVIPDVLVLQVGTSTQATYVQNISNGSIDMPIMQYPLLRSEHLPQLAANGDVILADLGAYVIWNRGELSISFSEHAAFTTGQVVWRFDERYDGAPWLKAAVTLAGPGSAFTQSPFIQHFYA